jgi:hypothetical protein
MAAGPVQIFSFLAQPPDVIPHGGADVGGFEFVIDRLHVGRALKCEGRAGPNGRSDGKRSNLPHGKPLRDPAVSCNQIAQ